MTVSVEIPTSSQPQNFTSGGPTASPAPFHQLPRAEPAGSVARLLPALQEQPRHIRVLMFLALFGTVTFVDLAVDRDFSLYALYVIPAVCAIWLLGSRWGYSACAVSALVWLTDDLIHEELYRYTAVSW